MKSRLCDCRKNVRPTARAINPASLPSTLSTLEFQTATGPVQFFVSDGVRASKYQTTPYEELQTTVAAIAHPSESLTSAVPKMKQKPTTGINASTNTIGIVPCGSSWRVFIITRAE